MAAFQSAVWEYYRRHGRRFPWRETVDPYQILVSEFMLQQTQVSRVEAKYAEFLQRFPTVQDLADAAVGEVLVVWQGLGYNRRALNLLQAAKRIVHEHQGRCPGTMHELMALPGVGRSTAGAVAAFAFGVAHPFVETNIRAALVHHFVPPGVRVSERWLVEAAARVLDVTCARDWYYALMDYGADLKRTTTGLTARAGGRGGHGRFAGSRRQLRAQLLRLILAEPGRRAEALSHRLQSMAVADWTEEEIGAVLAVLEREGFVVKGRDGGLAPA